MKKNEPIYLEMKSLAPYFLALSGIYTAALLVLCFAFRDISLPLGGVYGEAVTVLSFFTLGKTCQAAARRRDEKQANKYMSRLYAARYLGLFALLVLGALVPFINLIASVVPLFFTRLSITIREIKNSGVLTRSKKKEE